MKRVASIRRRLLAAAVLGLLGPAAGLAGPAPAETFPEFESIRGHVAFWTRVFAEWSLGQVVVHDLDHPTVVYEVVPLPGDIEERYTDEQLEFVEELNELWQERLRELEEKLARGQSLDEEQKAWVLRLTTNAGTDAVDGAAERVRTQRGLRERFRRGIEISHRYEPAIRRILRESGLPEELAAMPHVESSFQAEARSSAGAVGIWQFTRGTGRHYLKINAAVDERLDPILATRGAVRYLADAYERLGDWPIALTSYNHGVEGMARAVRQHGADYEAIFREYRGRLFGFASKNFYSEFLAALEIAADPARYFPEGFSAEPPVDHDGLVLEERTTPARLAKVFGVPLDALAGINPAWSPRAVDPGLALPAGLTVWLPAGTLERVAANGGSPDYGVPGAPAEGSYVVRAGDTLISIAAAHGMRVRTLRLLNGIPSGASLIRVGQRLRVAGADHEGVHVVRRGDNPSRIATRYGVALTDLLRANDLSPSSVIHPGQPLLIPAR